jgi:DNA helicase-2/ATP-dependent DNA helicase PcrA
MTADTTASPSGAEPRAFVLLKSRRRLDLLNPDPHGAKAIEILERDASFFDVSLLKAVETAVLPPKTKEAGLQFVEHIRAVAGNTTLTLADQLSLLLDRTGYRAMLRESRAENMEQRLENLGELLDIAGAFHGAREFLDHAALATNRERGGDEDMVSLMTLHNAKGLEFPHVFLPAFEAGIIPSSYVNSIRLTGCGA